MFSQSSIVENPLEPNINHSVSFRRPQLLNSGDAAPTNTIAIPSGLCMVKGTSKVSDVMRLGSAVVVVSAIVVTGWVVATVVATVLDEVEVGG